MEKKMTWDDVGSLMSEFLGYNFEGATSNGALYQPDFSFSTNDGRKIRFTLQCAKDDPYSAAEAFEHFAREEFDPEDRAAEIYMDGRDDGVSLRDALRDMDRAAETLRDDAVVFVEKVKGFDAEVTKESVRNEAARLLDGEMVLDESALSICKNVVHQVKWGSAGDPKLKEKYLGEILLEGGMTDDSPAACAKALNAIRESYNRDAAKKYEKPLNTVRPGIPERTANVHRMFDELFNKSYIDPAEYADHVVLPAGSPAEFSGEIFWKKAVDHAVNSGGALWQDTYKRCELLDRFGLSGHYNHTLEAASYKEYQSYMAKYGTPADVRPIDEFRAEIFPNAADMTEFLQGDKKLLKDYKAFSSAHKKYLDNELFSKADKVYGKLMLEYLRDVGALDDRKRDKLISDFRARKNSGPSMGR